MRLHKRSSRSIVIYCLSSTSHRPIAEYERPVRENKDNSHKQKRLFQQKRFA